MKFVMTTLVAVLLSGCAAKVPALMMDEVEAAVPGSWATTKEAKSGVDVNWVQRFGDNQLESMVREALKSNQDMRIAAERLKRAGESARMAGALAKPQMNFTATGDKRNTRFIGFPFGGSLISESYGVDLNINWEPDLWGKVRAKKSASMAEWQAGGQDYRAAKASLAAQVCKAWFALAEANEQVSLAAQAVRLRAQAETMVKERYQRDMRAEGGTAAQLRLAQTELATAKAEQSARRGNLDAASRQLELLLGRYPQGKASGRVRLPRIPANPPAGLPSELLLRRPDILAAERRYAASVKWMKEAQLAIFPSFSMTGSSGTTTESLGKIINSDFGVWSIGASLFQPLLTGGRVRSEIRTRESKQQEALAILHKTVINAFGEVEQALASEHWLARRQYETRLARDLASDAAKAAEDDYREGNGDVLTLLSAQSSQVEVESQYATLRRMRLANRVDLHLALGGGFELKP